MAHPRVSNGLEKEGGRKEGRAKEVRVKESEEVWSRGKEEGRMHHAEAKL